MLVSCLALTRMRVQYCTQGVGIKTLLDSSLLNLIGQLQVTISHRYL